MTPNAMFIAGLILLPAVGLVTWAWFAIVQVDNELRTFNGFEGMHFEIGPQAAENSESAGWPIPG